MEWILDRDPRLVIVPDAGSNDYEQHKILYDKGMKICILDHHEAPKKSEWAITINNQLSSYPNKQLCGGGIVWQFLRYVNDFEKKDGYCYEFMDLVALANISDMMS
jgi:single-stranded-DNA-specific exonuclease